MAKSPKEESKGKQSKAAKPGAGIHDPVAGQLVPSGDAAAGRGLWTARQLCDSVEFRRNPSGVAVTLHLTLPDQV